MNEPKPSPGYLHEASKSWTEDAEHDFKPCPFCGHWPYVTKVGNELLLSRKKSARGNFIGIEVKCSGCFITKRTGVFRSTFDQGMIWALEHWNGRDG